MQDEAVTTYSADIDQVNIFYYFFFLKFFIFFKKKKMTQGHTFLKSTFGVIPREGWQIGNFFI